ncbi:MAG: InlB B-repeat-containing protein [Acutalibacteraceae bacterium]|nr:InlB B-repeat-containing protein [Acutalibacteraceae bacterium]
MFKKALSVLIALLMLLSIVPVALAEGTEYNYTIKTEFYGYDSETDDWVPVTAAAGGDTVKMRVTITTNYVSGSGNFLLAYDKSLLSADLPSNGSATYLETNPDRKSFAYKNIQQVRAAHGTGAATNQLTEGNITEEEFNKYSFITGSMITRSCVVYDGADWMFEVDMKVLGGTKGKTFECIVLPGTVQSKSNPKGVISFPKAPDGSTNPAELAAALNWYEGTPVINAVSVDITADNTVPVLYNVEWFVDGVAERTEEYEAGAVINEYIPEKYGYTFTGWVPEVPSLMPEDDLSFTAQWEVNSYAVTFDAQGGIFTNGDEILETNVDFGADIIASETPVRQGYVFAGWSDSPDGEILESLGSIDEEADKEFYAVWIESDDVAYTVETYTMLANGEYSLASTGHTGTTGEKVTASVSAAEGFILNEEKSVLSGEVSADGSLVLKVYYDRKSYKFTTVVNGVSQSVDYLYGENITQPATPSVKGYTFTNWSGAIPSTMPANDVTVTAVFRIAATVKIKNNPGSKTINYGEILRLTAEKTAELPDGAYIKWYVDGSGVSMSQNADGSVCEIKSTGSGTVTVTAKVVDKNGNPVMNGNSEISDSQKVVSKGGFFQKIVSFFKNLFGINRTIIQMFRVF